jgi:plastocyanin
MKPLVALSACLAALVAAAPASATIEVAGTGEPAFTNTTTNTQHVTWDAGSGSIESYRLRIRYLKDGAEVYAVTHNVGLKGTAWLDWAGVATLQEGHTYSICVTGEYKFHNDSLYFPDGPSTCSTGPAAGKRTATTIDRTAPTVTVQAAGGAEFAKGGSVPVRIDFQDNLAGPYPSNYLCVKPVQQGTDPAASCASYLPADGCSVPSGKGKDTTFDCQLATGDLADGPTAVCAIGTDGAGPDRPRESNQNFSASETNRSRPQCDTVTIDRTAPAVGITASKTSAPTGESISFSGQGADATSGLDGGSARWEWGDGSETAGQSATHSFAQPGTYAVKLRMRDRAGNESIAEQVVTVTAAPKAEPAPSPGPGTEPTPGAEPTPGTEPTPGSEPTPAPGPGGPGSGPAPAPPAAGPSEKEIAAAAGGGPVLTTELPDLSILAPKRFRLGKSKSLVVGVTTRKAGQLTLSLVRGKKVVARLAVGLSTGSTVQKVRLPKGMRPGTHSLRISFKPNGSKWSASGAAKIAFAKAKGK